MGGGALLLGWPWLGWFLIALGLFAREIVEVLYFRGRFTMENVVAEGLPT